MTTTHLTSKDGTTLAVDTIGPISQAPAEVVRMMREGGAGPS